MYNRICQLDATTVRILEKLFLLYLVSKVIDHDKYEKKKYIQLQIQLFSAIKMIEITIISFIVSFISVYLRFLTLQL